MNKIILILIDGLRPDALAACDSPAAKRLLAMSRHTLTARTVMPSVTLPCHMSLFHSVDPERHNITTNTYTPQVRPVSGLVEQLDRAGKKCAFYFTWEELRDLSRPDSLAMSYCINQHKYRQNGRCADTAITEAALRYIEAESPDFLFLYLGDTDEVGGHNSGWMSETYMQVVANALECSLRVRESVSEEYTVIVTADHGGHGRAHGADIPEDMTIPVLFTGPSVTPGEIDGPVSIKDIAPTIVQLLGADRAPEWEGKALPLQ